MDLTVGRAAGLLATCLAIVGVATPATTDPGAALRTQIEATRAQLLAHYRDIDARTKLADVVEMRLDGDEANLFAASKPDGASSDAFWSWNTTIVSLDRSLVTQLAAGEMHPIAAVRGIDEVVIPAGDSGTSQPCALLVPSDRSPLNQAPLVVLLHPKGATDASALARPLVRQLVETSGAIAIAPYAHGDELRSSDVYAALDAVESAFSIDRRRVYIAGESTGGFAAFSIAAMRPSTWTAVLSMGATMDPADQSSIRKNLGGKAIYVVVGSSDPILPIDGVRRSIAWFRSVGISASYYEVPGAGGGLETLAPSLQLAWQEMLAGIHSRQPAAENIPTITPPPSQKP